VGGWVGGLFTVGIAEEDRPRYERREGELSTIEIAEEDVHRPCRSLENRGRGHCVFQTPAPTGGALTWLEELTPIR